MKSISTQLLQTLKIIALAIIFTLIISTVSASPTAYPPSGNVPSPINAGSSAQIKQGGLGLNSLSVFGSQYIQEKLGIGTTDPQSRLHVNGQVGISNNKGSWNLNIDDNGALQIRANTAGSGGDVRLSLDDNSGQVYAPTQVKSSSFCLGSSCISAWSQAGQQTTSVNWNNIINKPAGFADNVDNVGSTSGTYSVSRSSLGTSSNNIGNHNFCAISSMSTTDGSESCLSSCDVSKSGNSWVLSATQSYQCPGAPYSNVSCSAICMN